eukprot:CCRYP_010351-RA/>CCRYP_010351-RA protein AED:0.16 eAED:0.16 QI:166/1/1/1/0/0/2/25/165
MIFKRSQSESLTLLEEWPSSKQQKRVTFSQYSTKRIYKCSQLYRSHMSYTCRDQKVFRDETRREGQRIQQFVSLHSVKTGTIIHHLIKLNLLSTEELLGIEHLISKDAAVKVLKQRHAHVELVLRVQKELRERNEENVDKLAQCAMHSSSKSVHIARLRAALAAE